MGRSSFCGSDGLRKGAWTAEEDHKLVSYIQKHGEGGWRFLPQKAGLQRCGKSCRLRWTNYLKPGIKRGDFTPEEDQTIFQLHAELGNRWAAIARHLPNRTDNEIKNYWNAHLKKRLANMGVDDLEKVGGVSTSSSGHSDDTGCAKPPQQSEQPTTQRSASALLLNKLATRVTQCIGAPLPASQTLQRPMPFNDNIGCAEHPGFFCYRWSSCTVPETSAYWARNNDTDSLVVPESRNTIDERSSASVLNDIMASEFASLSCVNELNDWRNNNNDNDNTIESGQIQVIDNHSDSTTVDYGLWDDKVIVDDDIIFDTVGSSLGFYNSNELLISSDNSLIYSP